MRKEKFSDKKLIVEGTTDLFAIAELRNAFSLVDNFDIVVLNTITNLENEINVRLKSSGLSTLGIVVDADENIENIWQNIHKIFSSNIIHLPTDLPSDGLIEISKNLKIGIWVMPNNQTTGILEDFIQYLIPIEDQLMMEIDIHIENVETKNLQKYNSNNKTKAKIHSWLALQDSPGTPIGKAISYKYFDTKNPECKVFKDWLDKLFN
jgi:hypothetical protein